MFKLIFQSAPIGLIFGQIGYWDRVLESQAYPENPRDEYTTFLHIKMKVVRSRAASLDNQNRFLRAKWS